MQRSSRTPFPIASKRVDVPYIEKRSTVSPATTNRCAASMIPRRVSVLRVVVNWRGGRSQRLLTVFHHWQVGFATETGELPGNALVYKFWLEGLNHFKLTAVSPVQQER